MELSKNVLLQTLILIVGVGLLNWMDTRHYLKHGEYFIYCLLLIIAWLIQCFMILRRED